MNIVEQLHTLLLSDLELTSPVLSGNMKAHIRSGNIKPLEREIVIEAPFYDMKLWKKSGNIVHTGAIINGRTDYAEWVNRLGAFAKGNESQYWVNRAIYDVVYMIAAQIGAEVINEL